jgi:hypothetical protein
MYASKVQSEGTCDLFAFLYDTRNYSHPRLARPGALYKNAQDESQDWFVNQTSIREEPTDARSGAQSVASLLLREARDGLITADDIQSIQLPVTSSIQFGITGC